MPSQSEEYIILSTFGTSSPTAWFPTQTDDVHIVVVLVYDWILTFPTEFRLIWMRKMTWAKFLFLLNRYLFIGLNIVLTFNDFLSGVSDGVSFSITIQCTEVWRCFCRREIGFTYDHLILLLIVHTIYTAYSCSGMENAGQALFIIHDLVITGLWLFHHSRTLLYQQFILDVPVIQVLRVYAISGKMWHVAILVAAFNVFPNLFAIVRFYTRLLLIFAPFTVLWAVQLGEVGLYDLTAATSWLCIYRQHSSRPFHKVRNTLCYSWLSHADIIRMMEM